MNIKLFSKPLIVLFTSTALAGGFGNYVWNEEHRPPILEIYVFALKSGRSMFIRTPEDKRILIDGGANSEIIRNLSDILPFYSRRIDIVIATNTEGKNVSGLIDVIERYKISKAYIPAFTLENLYIASSTDQIYKTFIETLGGKNIPIDELQQGRVIYLDSKVKLSIDFPIIPASRTDSKIAENPFSTITTNSSKFLYSKTSAPEILFDISYNKNSIVFLGNATNKVQKYVASTTSLENVDVLIVSHSALPANIAKQLIEKIKPQNLVYSKKVTDKMVADSSVLINNSGKDSSNKKKVVVDPLEYLDFKNRFNIKEIGTLKIVSDGERVIVTSEIER